LKPFRFMGLPAELRLMVYKRLPRQIKHSEIRYVTGYYASTNEKIGSTVVVITRHLPVAILRTSRQVFAEAHDIVANLIQTFVTESQPRVIGHDTNLVALQELIYLMRTERKAYLVSRSLCLNNRPCSKLTQLQNHLQNGRPFHVNATIRRHFQGHCYLDPSPWEMRQPRDIALFLVQAALATKAGTRAWYDTIATVCFADLDDWKTRSMLRSYVASQVHVPHHTAMSYPAVTRHYKAIKADNMCRLIHAPDREIKITPNGLPVRLNIDNYHADGSFVFEPCMSQEEWFQDWLPSS